MRFAGKPFRTSAGFTGTYSRISSETRVLVGAGDGVARKIWLTAISAPKQKNRIVPVSRKKYAQVFELNCMLRGLI
jgi:hypothetical protein